MAVLTFLEETPESLTDALAAKSGRASRMNSKHRLQHRMHLLQHDNRRLDPL